MIGYKGLNEKLQAVVSGEFPFQYEIGKTYNHSGKIKLCNSGFHFCKHLVDTFDYYNYKDSVFVKIKAEGDVKTNGNKSCCSQITIIEPLNGIHFCIEFKNGKIIAPRHSIKRSGFLKYYKNGILHRDDGPAVIGKDYYKYYKNGVLHRDDGPAIDIDTVTSHKYEGYTEYNIKKYS